ncbi:MAG: hypothetical protein AB8B99_02940 [Phormidesmis sp.]
MLSDPLPTDPTGSKLCQIFSYRWQSIEGTTDDASNPNWSTIRKYPLRPRALWKKFCDPKLLAGVRPGHQVQYALIDVDKHSKYRNLPGIDAIRDALETIGITRTILTRSSWNNGIHLWVPLPDDVPSFNLACALKYALAAQDIHIQQGQIETFPNVKAFGNSRIGQFVEYQGHRLPLQRGGGGAILNDDLQPIGGDIAQFLNQWDFCKLAQDMDALQLAMAQGRENHRKRKSKKTQSIEAWRADWDLEISEGWTGPGQTNSLLKTIAGYGRVFGALEGDALHDFVVTTAINAPGFEQHCGHQFDLGRKASAWARAAERYWWPLGTEPKRDKTALNINAERAVDAQTRIKAAYRWLLKKKQLPEGFTARLNAVCKLARASKSTLYKYIDLWNPPPLCVTPHGEGDTAIQPSLWASTDDPPNTPPIGELHTLPPSMKGVALDAPLKSLFSRIERGLQGGEKGFPQAEGST